jgi:hypothetical protein
VLPDKKNEQKNKRLMIKRTLLCLLLAVPASTIFSQNTGISSADLKEYVYFLASDSLK